MKLTTKLRKAIIFRLCSTRTESWRKGIAENSQDLLAEFLESPRFGSEMADWIRERAEKCEEKP